MVRILAVVLFVTTTVRADVLTVFETRGSAYERGFQHGQKFAKEIKADFASKGGWGWSVPAHHRTPAAINHFLIKIRALPNGMELVEEMQGIADGAGVPFTDIAGLNLTFDLGDRTSCSMALIPDGPDGPILLNTLDDFAGGRGYPMFVQVAHPTNGHAMVMLCNFGTVWAHEGLSDVGLAIGSTSGGIGAPRGGANYEGVYYALLSRYALQFFDAAQPAIDLFTANRQISKGINVSVLDRAGAGAILEYSSFAVGVRPTKGKDPIYATNYFQTDKYAPYPPDIEKWDYMKNARARFARFGELFTATSKHDLALARSIFRDRGDGKHGPICQKNSAMATWCAMLFECKSATAHAYLGFPTDAEPRVIKLDASKKPASGKPAPPSAAVQTVLNSTPLQMKVTYVKHFGGALTGVEDGGMRFTFKDDQGKERSGELGSANIQIHVPATLADIPSTSRASLWGRMPAGAPHFEATRISTYIPPHPWPGDGRIGDGEASGSLAQHGSDLLLTYDINKPPGKVVLAKNCKTYIVYRGKPDYLKAGQNVDVYGHVLFEGDAVHVSYLLIYVDDAEAQRLKTDSP